MTHYQTLNITPEATAEAIRTAWRNAMKRHHPDTGDGDRTKLAAVQAAYDVLGDESKRRAYDGLTRRNLVDDLKEAVKREQAAPVREWKWQKVEIKIDFTQFYTSATENYYARVTYSP